MRALGELYPGLLTEEERQAPGAFYCSRDEVAQLLWNALTLIDQEGR